MATNSETRNTCIIKKIKISSCRALKKNDAIKTELLTDTVTLSSLDRVGMSKATTCPNSRPYSLRCATVYHYQIRDVPLTCVTHKTTACIVLTVL